MKILLFSLLILAFLSTGVLTKLHIKTYEPIARTYWREKLEHSRTSIISFGHLPWGSEVESGLSRADPIDACDYINSKNDGKILVARRGHCSFSTQADYAELSGAKMLIIVNNDDGEVNPKLMADNSINLPTILIDKAAGDILLQICHFAEKAKKQISIAYDFKLQKGEPVEYHVWLSSATDTTFNFLKDMKKHADKLANVTKMEPHYAIFSDFLNEEYHESENCVCGGRYCAAAPNNRNKNTGSDVILEDLRQICVHKLYGQDKWWKYMMNFDGSCLSTERGLANCYEKAFKTLNVISDDVDKCMEDSWINDELGRCKMNKYLELEKSKRESEGILIFPSVNINGFLYDEDILPAENVFTAICKTFAETPEACLNKTGPYASDPASPDTRDYTPLFIVSTVVLLLVMMCGFGWYKGYVRREIYQQTLNDLNINPSEYVTLRDQEEGKGREVRILTFKDQETQKKSSEELVL